MKKGILKVLFIFIVFTICILNISNYVFAFPFNPNDYKPSPTPALGGDAKTIAESIIGAVQVIGSIVSVIALVVIGIKYMLGSLEEKAQYKKSLLPYVIGAVLVFATSNIIGIIYDFATTLNN